MASLLQNANQMRTMIAIATNPQHGASMINPELLNQIPAFFNALDVDHDNSLTDADFQMIATGAAVDPYRASKFMQIWQSIKGFCDIDGDGVVNLGEFQPVAILGRP